MPPIADAELIRRLLTAAMLGAMLGFEREIRQKSAGLRTNILIAVGAALFTLMSLELAPAGSDPGRIAAQIVTGIGFLGAGAIMRTDAGVQGLTTAATVWVNAAVGVGGAEAGSTTSRVHRHRKASRDRRRAASGSRPSTAIGAA